jgi:hypothetical protein
MLDTGERIRTWHRELCAVAAEMNRAIETRLIPRDGLVRWRAILRLMADDVEDLDDQHREQPKSVDARGVGGDAKKVLGRRMPTKRAP